MSEQAAITGASSGIGEAFSRALASRGYDLILIARRKERLESLASELSEKHSIQTAVWPADLSRPDEIQRVADDLKGEKVNLLINNAGFGIGENFDEIQDANRLRNMIEVHAQAPMLLSKALLPQMIERNEGAIINVASIAAFVATPGSAVYSASKAFLVTFSESLKRNLQGSRVKIQALCPGFTHSQFHDVAYPDLKKPKKETLLWMSAERVVRASLKALPSGKCVVIPGLINHLLIMLMKMPLVSMLLWAVYKRRKKL